MFPGWGLPRALCQGEHPSTGSLRPKTGLGRAGSGQPGAPAEPVGAPNPHAPRCLLWGVPSLWVDYRLGAWGPRDAGGPRGEPGEGREMRYQGFPGSSWDGVSGAVLQKAGSRARELRAVLGPGPEQTARRASVPGWCHQAEAQPGMPASERHPQAPTGTPPLARTPLATGSKSNWAQIALAEGADWSAASRVPRALPGVGRAGGGGAGFK